MFAVEHLQDRVNILVSHAVFSRNSSNIHSIIA